MLYEEQICQPYFPATVSCISFKLCRFFITKPSCAYLLHIMICLHFHYSNSPILFSQLQLYREQLCQPYLSAAICIQETISICGFFFFISLQCTCMSMGIACFTLSIIHLFFPCPEVFSLSRCLFSIQVLVSGGIHHIL